MLEADGIEGMTLELGPARTPVEIIGFVNGHQLQRPGLAVGLARHVARRARPPTGPTPRSADDVFQALGRRSGDVTATSPAAIDAATDGATESFTVDEAVDAIPGVEQQQTTFNQIIGVTVVIALVVIALFFALLTVERTALYGVLKAIGARSSRIFGGLVAAGGRGHADRRTRHRRRARGARSTWSSRRLDPAD